jgi:ABC-type antimicrobial peptide transport system permease subunit
VLSEFRLVVQSLRFHRRSHAAVGLGVLAGTAALTGALLVGDSVRHSLRQLVMERLGRIDALLLSPTFFRNELADELAADPNRPSSYTEIMPAILLDGTVERPPQDPQSTGGGADFVSRRAGQVAVVGVDPAFWTLDPSGIAPPLDRDQVVLNDRLAGELGAAVGDEVILRLPRVDSVPADSPLGRRTGTLESRRLVVSAVIPTAGLGRFSLHSNQALPRTAFVLRDTLARIVGTPGRSNALLAAAATLEPAPPKAHEALQNGLVPRLEDYGLQLNLKERPWGNWFELTSDQLILDVNRELDALEAWHNLQPRSVLTYLAEEIAVVRSEGSIDRRAATPYSTVAAFSLSPQPPLGPLLAREGDVIETLGDDEIVINQWMSEDWESQGIDVRPGDTVEIVYFLPETTHSRVESAKARFRLKAVAAMTGLAAEPSLTPEVKGVSDQESIANWDPPFPFDSRKVRSRPHEDQDDRYWKAYKATPKAFVSLSAGQRLWGSRFGQATAVWVAAAPQLSIETLRDRYQSRARVHQPSFLFQPVKRAGLEAAAGTTPFSWLFLGFSMFVIAAAALLVSLLFRLGIEQRLPQLGLLLAVGMTRARVRALLIAEGALVALIGSAAGAAMGVGYAWLMLVGLRTWWVKAVSTPFLSLHLKPASLAVGFAAGTVLAALVISVTLWQVRRHSPRELLAGRIDPPQAHSLRIPWTNWTSAGLGLAAAVIAFAGFDLGGEARAGAFFGSGALLLAALVVWLWGLLRRGAGSLGRAGATLLWLAWRSAARNPTRSVLSIGLVASSVFLIFATTAFMLKPRSNWPDKDDGTGGFTLIARSDQPLFLDWTGNAPGSAPAASEPAPALPQGVTVIPLRYYPGEEASCLNLYQTRAPQVQGLTADLVQWGGFEWAATAPHAAGPPWTSLLSQDRPPAAPVPVVLDQSTALYSLHLWGGVGSRFLYPISGGREVELEVAGLLKNSILQGSLLISEADFHRLFPDVSGYRTFLIAAPPEKIAEVEQTLEDQLGDYGFDCRRTEDVLAEFQSVQNTYLSTFQSLGGLGLLLGTVGLAAVQLRSIFERRGELGLMTAVGFRRRRLGGLVMAESSFLLLAGLGIGAATALVCVLPHVLSGGAAPPWTLLCGMLALILAVGSTASLLSVRAVLRSPLQAALRGE